MEDKNQNKKTTLKRLTLQEREKIQTGLNNCLNYYQLAEFVGRSRSTINYEVVLNGGRSNYNAIEAQNRSLNQTRRGVYKIPDETNNQRFLDDPAKIQQQIDSVKMQMQILSETIKEMKRNGRS